MNPAKRWTIELRVLAAAITACGALAWAQSVGAQEPERPNVLLILVDDLRPEINAYGAVRAVTPHIDALAAQGLLFERAYTQVAVCAPSRINLLSGLRADTTGIRRLRTPLRTVMPEVTTLPQRFQQNGYTTLSIGKVYHHQSDDRESWSEEPVRPKSSWEGLGDEGYLSPASIGVTDANTGRGPAYEAASVPDTAYRDGKIANLAIEQLRRRRDDPFFMAVGFFKPHLPFTAPQKYWDLYPPEEIELAPNPFPPEGANRFSLTNFGELRGYALVPDEGAIPDPVARTLIRAYLAATSYIDAQVGRVLAELDRLGLTENTVVVFWGDHGWKLGEHGAWAKHSNFEIDTRVPLIVRAPGMRSVGERTDALVETVDIYPTLTELAGLGSPPYLQGTSFVPLLEDPNRPWKTAAFSEYSRGPTLGRSIRTGRYRYVEWQRVEDCEVMARELYDHRNDSQENRNVAEEAGYYADVVESLSRRLADGWRMALPNP